MGTIIEGPDDLISRLRQEDFELFKIAKTAKEFITEYFGEVLSVTGRNESTGVTEGEMRFGGINPIKETGYKSHLGLSVHPHADDKILKRVIAPQKIVFIGNSPIAAGDFVKAGLFLVEKRYLHFRSDDKRVLLEGANDKGGLNQYILIPRGINPEEEGALYLKIIRGDKEVRTDFSVNYDPKFFS